ADVTRVEDIRRFIAEAQAAFGQIDSLICNAGGPPAGNFLSLDDEEWEKAFQLNVMNVVRLIREAVPHLKAAGGGHIINIGSSSLKQPISGLLLSNSLRLGAFGLMKTLAQELAMDQILVNTVSPGRIFTDRIS